MAMISCNSSLEEGPSLLLRQALPAQECPTDGRLAEWMGDGHDFMQFMPMRRSVVTPRQVLTTQDCPADSWLGEAEFGRHDGATESA